MTAEKRRVASPAADALRRAYRKGYERGRAEERERRARAEGKARRDLALKAYRLRRAGCTCAEVGRALLVDPGAVSDLVRKAREGMGR